MLRNKAPARSKTSRQHGAPSPLRLKPLAQAIALLMVAGGAHGATAFSAGWFADKGVSQAATAARVNAGMPGGPPPLSQQKRANEQLQRSLTNLNSTVASIAAQQAAQAAGRQAAFGRVTTIPDGLGEGGLKVDNSLAHGWINAQAPTQTQANGQTTVTIQQTADKAILNWETFNVGRNTTVDFRQQSDWAVLNRVNDPNARPSEIQGKIQGAGTVMIMNRNGVIFTGSSQVNVRNLVAAAATMSDEQFSQRGLYVDTNGSQATFTDAAGKVEVQRGALIQTHAPSLSTESGGYALLLGAEVENAGTLITSKGQTTLAAGDSFYIRRGVGTTANQRSTTRGNEVSTSLKVGSSAGKVSNTGLIQAASGDITLTGHQVLQNGVALASSSVDARGTIHLLNSASDTIGSVTLGQGSTTAILIDGSNATGLDSQRNNGLTNLDGTPNVLARGQFDNLGTVSDRTDQSRVEIVSGGTVDFQNGSITLATGGQIAVSAGQRSLVRDGATLDVAGAMGVKVSMESNNIKINIQGNEQRDASVNRDGGKLTNSDVWVDLRELIFVPAGTNGYATDRWYTAGGLLEVGGYLGTQGHTAGEWMAQGGTLTFTGKDVVTQQGAQLNLSGGTVDVQGGYIQQTWLQGANGRLYELSRAPGDILYSGIYRGYEDRSERWGVTDYYYDPMIASNRRYEGAYTVGRDAGKLVIGTGNAVLEGQIISDVFQGDRQTQAPILNLDGYQQSHKAAAQRAQLIVGSYTPIFNKTTGTLRYNLSPTLEQVLIDGHTPQIAAGLDLGTALPTERQGRLYLDSGQLSALQLGALKVAARDGIEVNGALTVAAGGNITLFAPQVRVNADLTAHSGAIQLGNVLNQINMDRGFVVGDVTQSPASGSQALVDIASGVTLDTRGQWTNLALDPFGGNRLAYLNGGTVSLRTTGKLDLQTGSRVDVRSGAALLAGGKSSGGKGGDVTLEALGQLALDGTLHGEGVNGGGTLAMLAQRVLISDTPGAPVPGTLQLHSDFFQKGFSAYDITGNEGLIVAEGTQVEVKMPVLHTGTAATQAPTGTAPSTVLQSWTPELYQPDAVKGVLTQRRGASLSLNAGSALASASDMATTQLTVGQGARIQVDPGQSIALRSVGQLTVDGTLSAWGGKISLGAISVPAPVSDPVEAVGHGRSIWIGDHALIDVASRAVTAVDTQGRTYGQVRAGGSISIGGDIDPVTGIPKADQLFVVVREGARLDASGAQALLDVPGQGRVQVASNGGSIALASGNGLYLDGSLVARAGGAGAAGGRLAIALDSPYYLRSLATSKVMQGRELILSQVHQASGVADNPIDAGAAMQYGQARLGVDQVEAGGFDSLALLSNGLLSFDGSVSLNLGQSLKLYSSSFALAEGADGNSRVDLRAPHLQLSGMLAPPKPNGEAYTQPTNESGLLRPPSQAVFSAQANLLDISGNAIFGLNGGFDQVNLRSRGDMRFLAGRDGGVTPSGFSTSLLVKGDLNLEAAQIYPASEIAAQVLVGYDWSASGGIPVFDPQRTLRISRPEGAVSPVPYSVFGRLQLGAATIEQGGVLRAPLGLIEIGTNQANGSPGITQQLRLLPGSLTSVSGAGLVLPYGGTVDGQVYRYNGKTVTFLGQGAVPLANSEMQVGLIMGGKRVEVMSEAVVDLSGGGELLGAGFVSGRGGSTDARYNPLVQIGADGKLILPGLGTNPIYAIVPGVQAGYAPGIGERGASDPLVGQQVTIGAGVPGLAAGTYTLLPSTYALMPGAFRVEINGLAGAVGSGVQALRNGSWTTAGQLSIANTAIHNSLASQLILTSGDVLRRYSQYNETSLAQFAMADAARQGVVRPLLAMDAKTLKLGLVPGQGVDAFSFAGIGKFQAAPGGFGGTVSVLNTARGTVEIVAGGQQATPLFTGLSLDADALNAIGASRMMIGGLSMVQYGQGGNIITFAGGNNAPSGSIVVRNGAVLSAPEVFLVSNGDIVVEQGASINTIGRGKAAYDARDGFVYQGANMLAVSNGLLNILPPTESAGGIKVGTCSTGNCTGQTSIYSEGSIVASTGKNFELGDAVRYGTRHLALALGNINVGSPQALAAAAASQVLPIGLTLNQAVLDRLLQGDTQFGAPALETLQLTAREAFNFYGTTTLDTYDASTGKSRLNQLLLTTPAIYGAGDANDVATIHTANLIWQGVEGVPGSLINGGAGTGSGRLDIRAERIDFGYGAFAQPSTIKVFDRLALGFANVNLSASDRISANHKGSLSVYQSQGAFEAGKGYAYSGGNLNILTPLLTGEAGSVNRITAGGALTVAGTVAGTGVAAGKADGQGAELSLHGANLTVASAVVLPSGKLKLSADGDVLLTDEALLDVAGRAIVFNDLTKYSWGGDITLQSEHGNIRQAAGSRIDLSAAHNQAGKLHALALDAAGGVVDLQGRILGSSSGLYDAGGTLVPYAGAGVEIRAQRLGTTGTLDEQFAALNQRLNDGQVFGGRSFQLKQGDLTIGDGLKAGEIDVSLDNGQLRVTGRVDASGARVGSIRLAAQHGLTLDAGAVLDAHGSLLRVDSYGKIIDSPNRAKVELSSGDGVLTLASGAHIDLRHGTAVATGSLAGQHDGRARGTLELNAPRLEKAGGAQSDDIAIDARGALDIQGARSIAVNGMVRYDDAPDGTDPAASGRPYQVITQTWLNDKHTLSERFINAALNNADLMQNKLAGLNNATYADAFHLRPGVEIVSKTPDGDLVVQGDLDLSGYRYESVNALTQKTPVYGSGEVGSLILRAGGDLNIYGSINDGFAPPPPTVDDTGWQLQAGMDFTSSVTVVPGLGVTLADGTTFAGGSVLNYDLPIKAMNMIAGTRLPVAASLSRAVVLPAGTVLAAAVRDKNGNLLIAAGTLLSAARTLPIDTIMDAGTILSVLMPVKALVWPKGLALPARPTAAASADIVTLSGSLELRVGALIPSGTNIKLPGGAASVALRPEIGGRQGALWAIAPMLAEGSQSWSMRLVAGADTAAADSRIVKPQPTAGQLLLADSHYGMFAKELPPKGDLTWTQVMVDDLAGLGVEIKAGDLATDEFLDSLDMGLGTVAEFCSGSPAYCAVKVDYAWTQAGVDVLASINITVGLGSLIDDEIMQRIGADDVISFCADSPEFCKSLSDREFERTRSSSRFSVLRTGTGDLELHSAGNLRMATLYGVYTAGTSSAPTAAGDLYNQPRNRANGETVLNDAGSYFEKFVDGGADSLYRAWYPEQGGNLMLKVGGDLSGTQVGKATSLTISPNPRDAGYESSRVATWLWRQGSGEVATGFAPQPTAWWINFGTYAGLAGGAADQMVGFTGFGTLGGGDVNVQVAGDAGALKRQRGADINSQTFERSQGLVLAVGSTGRVAADGSLQLTGGGDLTLNVGGTLNPESNLILPGVLTNLRGHAQVSSAAIGSIDLHYGSRTIDHANTETRAFDMLRATRAEALGGITLMPGDATFSLSTLGDLVLHQVADPGRVEAFNDSAFKGRINANSPLATGRGLSWFSLWTERTAIDLFSAGGNLTPLLTAPESDLGIVYPSILRAVAASGSLYYGEAKSLGVARDRFEVFIPTRNGLLLAPSNTGQLQLLAGDSIYGGDYTISQSSAAASAMATPQRPAFMGFVGDVPAYGGSNLAKDGSVASSLVLPLFAFGSNTATNQWLSTRDPARFYALSGDLVGVNSGRAITFTSPSDPRFGQTRYEGAQPVWMMAGRDIVSSGTGLIGGSGGNSTTGNYRSSGNLFIHQDPNDISVVSAGRDILYSNFMVAGPGTLEISAGRNILMEDKVSVTSLGAVVAGDKRPGASVAMLAGVGAEGPDYAGFVERYLNPANLLAGGPLGLGGQVAKTYDGELRAWLAERFGFAGDSQQALVYFKALPGELQRVFARDVYFAELRAAGREYNEEGGVRQGSYVRGRAAIATLFPEFDVAGNRIAYQGAITLFGGAGVHTDFGGNIQMLTPGGSQTYGIEGVAPPASAGIITQGAGNIELYSLGSILLGQSRVMTTFGGAILGWSAGGDINAGRGSKTTVVYTPPKRVYDTWGNVTLSPSVPSTGAGIATLNPIAEVAPGDIDLIAPLGTIDAGEAGIRVSGNINIAALRVVNAANIQTQGKSSGVPVVAAVNTGAMTSASSAGAAASQAAQSAARQQQAAAQQDRASVFSVEVLGFGKEAVQSSRPQGASRAPSYDAQSPVQVLGAGPLSEQARLRLTEEERGNLTL